MTWCVYFFASYLTFAVLNPGYLTVVFCRAAQVHESMLNMYLPVFDLTGTFVGDSYSASMDRSYCNRGLANVRNLWVAFWWHMFFPHGLPFGNIRTGNLGIHIGILGSLRGTLVWTFLWWKSCVFVALAVSSGKILLGSLSMRVFCELCTFRLPCLTWCLRTLWIKYLSWYLFCCYLWPLSVSVVGTLMCKRMFVNFL